MFLAGTCLEAKAPPGYLALSAQGKQTWQRNASTQTQYPVLPKPFNVLCRSLVAFPGAFFRSYMNRTLNEESGYPTDSFWRRIFGKAFHPYGMMAPGEVAFTQSMLGLPAGKHPVTFRMSLANAYVRGLPGQMSRPGLLVIFHGGVNQADINLFTMPEDGLIGFAGEVNMFGHPYSNWINAPTGLLKFLANLSFGRVTQDFTTQWIDEEAPQNFSDPSRVGSRTSGNTTQLFLEADPFWQMAYENTDPQGDYRQRLIDLAPMISDPLSPATFIIRGVRHIDAEHNEALQVGTARVLAPWIASKHSDRWFAEHAGFLVKE